MTVSKIFLYLWYSRSLSWQSTSLSEQKTGEYIPTTKQHLMWARLFDKLWKLWSLLQQSYIVGRGSCRHEDQKRSIRSRLTDPKNNCYNSFQKHGTTYLLFRTLLDIWSLGALQPHQRAVGGEVSLWTLPRCAFSNTCECTGEDALRPGLKLNTHFYSYLNVFLFFLFKIKNLLLSTSTSAILVHPQE